MKKVVPEVIAYFCDSCGSELKGTDKNGNYKIKMSCDGLDHAGHAVGNGKGGSFDACYKCYCDILNRFDAST